MCEEREPMKVGIVSPVVVQVPGGHAAWEADAGIEELTLVARTADRLGLHHLTCSEHVAVPEDVAAQRGGTYWDPLATLSYVAAHTSSIRLATQVLVLGYHHPLQIAKRYGTLDRISGGRVVLGVGVGTLEAEFELLGVPFERRGPRADDAMRALRAALDSRVPEYHGEFYDFAGFVVEPHAQQERVPLWVGGSTPLSLRRALAFGDGWVPAGVSRDELARMLAGADLPKGFEVVLGTGRPLDPSGDPGRAEDALAALQMAGATVAGVTLRSASVVHYCEQLEALTSVAGKVG
jgi:probable F420-dependent oxidoreductase